MKYFLPNIRKETKILDCTTYFKHLLEVLSSAITHTHTHTRAHTHTHTHTYTHREHTDLKVRYRTVFCCCYCFLFYTIISVENPMES